MSRYCRQSVALMALVTAVVLCLAQESVAKKPGGGGGGGPGQNGGGVIYFVGPTPTDRYATELYTMNDDGSGMAVVAGFPAGFATGHIQPSRQLHAGKRWFPGWQGGEHLVALSDAGDVVALEVDPQLEGFYDPIWRVGDGSHLLYVHRDNLGFDSYIARANSNGTGKSRLTDASVGSGLFWIFGPTPSAGATCRHPPVSPSRVRCCWERWLQRDCCCAEKREC